MSNQNLSISRSPFARVVLGSEFLDRNQPNWLDIVEERFLNLAGADECPLGQIGRHLDPDHSDPGMCYLVAVDALGLDTDAMLRLGFAAELDEVDSLNAAWVTVIGARRRIAAAAERAGVDDVEIISAPPRLTLAAHGA